MSQKGLTIDIITKTAAKLIEENGYDKFSLRELAARLGVKAASLYNHVGGIAEISTAVGLFAIGQLNRVLSEAVKGKDRDDAIKVLALAYRTFAKENPELYRAVIRMPLSENDMLVHAVSDSFEPIMNIIYLYTKDKEKSIHIFRSFRSVLHGFISLEAAGFLRHNDINIDDSYNWMIDSYIQMFIKFAND